MAVKRRNWKMHFFRQDTLFDPAVEFGVPVLYNLYTAPREEKPAIDTWVITPMLKIVDAFKASTRGNPLILMETPDHKVGCFK